jgi:hypothetical protein
VLVILQFIVRRVFFRTKYLDLKQLVNQDANQYVLLTKIVYSTITIPIVIVTHVCILRGVPQMSCKERHARVKWFYTRKVIQSIENLRLAVVLLWVAAPPPPQTTLPHHVYRRVPSSTASAGSSCAHQDSTTFHPTFHPPYVKT